MKSKYAVFLSIMMSLVLIASVIGCSKKPASSSTTSVVPPTSSTTNPPTSSTTKPPTSSTTKPPTTALLPGQTLLIIESGGKAAQMIHLASEIKTGKLFNDCVSCHWLGSVGQKDPKLGVINIVSTTHHCAECHPAGIGLPPEPSEDYPRELMMNLEKVTAAQVDTSCVICHEPAKG